GVFARKRFVAFELDENGQPGRPSPALSLFTSDAGFGATNLWLLGQRKTFNLENTPFDFRGGPPSCMTGEPVEVRLRGPAAWPGRPAACTGGWSCTIDFAGLPDGPVSIEISETAPDGTSRSETLDGFSVDLHRPADAVLTAPPPPVIGHTPPSIAGAGEPGAE